MTEGDAKVKDLAQRYIAIHQDIARCNDMRELIEAELLKCVGQNVQERFILVANGLVHVHYKDGVHVKKVERL